jgi:predicted Zn-dependent peptidase
MMFRGSRNYPSFNALAKAFEWLGGEWNAATGYDMTEYWYSGHRRTIAETIELFKEFLVHPLLLNVEIERDIIKRELMKELNEYGHSTDLAFHSLAQMWPGTSLALPILGNEANIARFSKADLKAHRGRFYTPDNMVLCVIGGESGVLDQVAKAFGRFGARAPAAKKPAWPPVKTFKGPRLSWVNHPDNEYQIQVSFPTVGEFAKDALNLEFLCRILGDGFSSRLQARIREELGLVYDLDVSMSFFTDRGSMDISASVGPKEFMTFFRELFRLLKAMQLRGPSNQEFELARRRALMDLELMPTELEALAHRFSRCLLTGKDPALAGSVRRIMAVDRDGIHAVAAALLTQKSTSVVVLGPESQPLQDKLTSLLNTVF